MERPDDVPEQDRSMTAQRLLAELLASSQRQEHQLAQAVQTIRGDLDMIWERLRSLGDSGDPEPLADELSSESVPAAPAEPEIGPPVAPEVAAPPVPPEPPVEPPAVETAVPAEVKAPVEPVVIRAAAVATGRPGWIENDVDWESILLGRDLADNAELADCRKQLVQGLCRGDPAETALVGQLLSFRAATPERMPVLLRDVGEAYYRWQPTSGHAETDPMRDALIAWIQAVCGKAGVTNTVALVHVGDRFDSKRHNAKERGGEVAGVCGWIVLRENGSVYTKASVAVR